MSLTLYQPYPMVLKSGTITDPYRMKPSSNLLFHITTPETWHSQIANSNFVAPSLDSEGFIHLSFADQVAGTLAKHFPGCTDLLLLEINPDRITSEIRIEDLYGSGKKFPHVYGPLPRNCILRVLSIAEFYQS